MSTRASFVNTSHLQTTVVSAGTTEKRPTFLVQQKTLPSEQFIYVFFSVDRHESKSDIGEVQTG